MAAPRPPLLQKPILDLELTILCAKHLKNVNWRNGELKPYAVAYIDPDRRSATKPDDSSSTKPIWNEHLTLPLPYDHDSSSSLFLTLDIFHSKPSETPKPLVGTTRVSLKDLLPDFPAPSAGPSLLKTLDLHRPSGRPHGKIKIKVVLRERPMPVPQPPQEQNYQMPPPHPSYYYSTAPPQQTREYSVTHSPPPPQYSYSGSGYSSVPYSAPAPYYNYGVPPPRPTVYYDMPVNYGGPSAPAEYGYEQQQRQMQLQKLQQQQMQQQQLQQQQMQQQQVQKQKGPRMGLGTGLAVGMVAGALGGLALEEGIKYEEEKIAERVENDVTSDRDAYSDY